MAAELGSCTVIDNAAKDPQGWAVPSEIVAGPTSAGEMKSGYTLWAFDGTAWKLTKDRSAPGYQPSAAPTVPGKFKGQIRAVLSIPR